MAAGCALPWRQAECGRSAQGEDGHESPGQRKPEPVEDEQKLSRQQETEAMEGTALALFEQRNKFCVGDKIEIMKPDGRNVPVMVEAMYNEEGEAVESCPHARQKIWIRLSETPQPYDLLRVANQGARP